MDREELNQWLVPQMKSGIICFLFFAFAGPLYAEKQWIGRMGDERVSVVIPFASLDIQPRWNPSDASTPAPPIALPEALALAKKPFG